MLPRSRWGLTDCPESRPPRAAGFTSHSRPHVAGARAPWRPPFLPKARPPRGSSASDRWQPSPRPRFPHLQGRAGGPTWLYHAECTLEAKLAQALPGEKEGALRGVALFFKPPAQDTLVENPTGRAGAAAAGGRLDADPL